MVILGFVWLALLVFELAWGERAWSQWLGMAIWVVFVLDFLLRLALAPRRLTYLRHNWLTLIAVAVPPLRVFRLARALRLLRFGRGLLLVRVLASLSRGARTLGRTMRRRGLGYVVLLTTVVVLVSAAGMYAFETGPQGRAFASYAEALWWTAMLMTTLGSDYWPRTPEGRVLSLLLAVYAVAVFGYIAGALASYFVDQDADLVDKPLRRELAELRAELRALREALGEGRPPPPS